MAFGGILRQAATRDPNAFVPTRPSSLATVLQFGPVTREAFDEAARVRLCSEGERVARNRYQKLRDAWMRSTLGDRGVVHTCEHCMTHEAWARGSDHSKYPNAAR